MHILIRKDFYLYLIDTEQELITTGTPTVTFNPKRFCGYVREADVQVINILNIFHLMGS